MGPIFQCLCEGPTRKSRICFYPWIMFNFFFLPALSLPSHFGSSGLLNEWMDRWIIFSIHLLTARQRMEGSRVDPFASPLSFTLRIWERERERYNDRTSFASSGSDGNSRRQNWNNLVSEEGDREKEEKVDEENFAEKHKRSRAREYEENQRTEVWQSDRERWKIEYKKVV